jgi:predicted transcriptional regulator
MLCYSKFQTRAKPWLFLSRLPATHRKMRKPHFSIFPCFTQIAYFSGKNNLQTVAVSAAAPCYSEVNETAKNDLSITGKFSQIKESPKHDLTACPLASSM